MTTSPLLFTKAAVFDGSDERQPTMNVLVVDGRIEQVSPEPVIGPPGCEVVDVAGRTLMPGLIDAHVHCWLADLDLALATQRRNPYLAAFAFKTLGRMLDRGFTTVRDAGGTEVGYTLALEAGLVRGPRLLHTGRFISQTGGHFDVRTAERFDPPCGCGRLSGGAARFATIVDGTDEMIRAVREELRTGAKQVKLMASGGVASPTDPLDRMQFSDAEITTAVEEAERRGAYVMAHCHPASAIERCARLGVRSIEHGSFMNDEAAHAVAEAGAYVVPTMATVWALLEDGPRQGLPAASQQKAQALAEGVLRGLETMRRHGLQIGFGTDLLGPQQDRQATEFELRSQVFPAGDILRSATTVNAAILRMDDRIGRVAPGYVADLIVVDGDPLRDLSVLGDPDGRSVDLVMQAGAIVKRTAPPDTRRLPDR
ncbi:amidohydrolase family protein [Mycobacterium sp. WMMD1722]|uniref:metal-dependent hydrolase family protein n=1 Tax=Mycobacterium sp. WMMD1722 TaxID=3404117 RepID=UPI003BF52D37